MTGTSEGPGATADGPGAVRKALRVLEALPDHGGVTELAAATGLPKSTVHRLLRVLVETGFARTDDSGYRTGDRVLALAGKVLYRFDPAVQADPALVRLRDDTGCTVHFAMRFGGELLYVHKVEPDKPYRMGSRVGMRLPWHTSAIGKAVLAELEPDAARALAGPGELPARTANSLTGWPELTAQLAEVRAAGHALDDGENEAGVRCTGAAVRDHSGAVVGGISVSTLALEHGMDELREFGPRVRAAAAEVSTALGHRR
ncbi:IclR family transcriptional regulator [Saccharopolyspora sp. NPDC047091]|uniref:IclR family transcriptional regulator n=1 Tax=Saccharopolyspora sp. NPDC047091 TaxID=3155924 RepID=UPI0033F95A09